MKKQKGLTLIELLTVFGIVALLAMLGLPKYREYSIKARVAQAVDAINTVNKEIIQAHNDGLLNCDSSAITINGNAYPTGNNVAFNDFPGVLNGIQIGSTYNIYSCGDTGHTIATAQYSIVNRGELVCILQVKGGVAYQRCGVWDGSEPGQVPTGYLPAGYDCLLSGNQTVRGTECVGFLTT